MFSYLFIIISLVFLFPSILKQVCLHWYWNDQLFIYISLKCSAVCLYFHWYVHLFVYFVIEMFSCLLAFSLECSAVYLRCYLTVEMFVYFHRNIQLFVYIIIKMFSCLLTLKCLAVWLYFIERVSCLFTFFLVFGCWFSLLTNVQLFVYIFSIKFLFRKSNFETGLFTFCIEIFSCLFILLLEWSAVCLYFQSQILVPKELFRNKFVYIFIDMFSCLFTMLLKGSAVGL